MKLSHLVSISCLSFTVAHSRWACPEPRSSSTGIKSGPCGSDYNVFDGSIMEVSPGSLTVTFEESIHHTGESTLLDFVNYMKTSLFNFYLISYVIIII